LKTSSPRARRTTEPLPTAVIIGLDCITGLQTARILARRGVPVVGIAARPDHFCCRTNAVRRVIRSATSGESLLTTLMALAGMLRQPAVLVPCTDLAVLTVSGARERLGAAFRMTLPDHEVVEMLMDKERFAAHAEATGLPVPRTRLVRTRAEAERAANELSYPVVLKPRLKTVEWQRNTSAKAFKTSNADELLATYDRVGGWSDVLLLQEWIDGGEENLYSCNCYYDRNGKCIATFVARKLRQWPPQTGTSSLGEECRNDAVLRATLQLFSGVSYRGLGYVEMKRDARTGSHYVIEPNVGRPTGRSSISEAGGVELHFAAYCETAGLPLPPQLEQRYGGAKWIYLRHDVQSALYYWRRGELSLADWWRSISGRKTEAVLDLSDPKPFVADLLGSVAGAARAAGRRFGGA
jgi:predicted ATP-grasp superfamily ATP-dependent carboligase